MILILFLWILYYIITLIYGCYIKFTTDNQTLVVTLKLNNRNIININNTQYEQFLLKLQYA